MKCENCGYENDSDAKYCERCGKSLLNLESGITKTNKVLIVFIIVLVVGIAVSAGALLTGSTLKQPIVNNSTPQNTTITETQTNTTQTSDKTATETSSDKGVNLEGYTLTEVRDATKGVNPGECKFCHQWAVKRTVYEYHNSAGNIKMIGENYCTNCGGTWRDMWQNGEWSDL